MLGRKDWKYGVLLMFSTLMLVWLVGGIGLMEPRQGIIVYPLVVIAFVSLLNFVSKGRFAKLFLLIVPFIIGFFVYLIYSSIVSLNGLPVLLAPGFTITRPEAILQIVLSFVGVFSVTFLALTAVSKRLLFMLKNSNVGRFIIRRNLIVAIICITLIVTQGFLANQALVEGGTWSNISLQDVNLSQSADYLNRLPSSNGSLMTTLMASAPLNYLTSRVTLQPPPSEDDFSTSLQKQEFDYLVLVPKSPIIWNPRPDYFEEFIYSSPDGMHKIYNVSGLQFFNSGLDDYNWEQFNNDSLAVYQDDGLYVGGNQSSGIDSGLVSKGIFYPFNLNVTCTLSSLGKSSHSPGVFWNNSVDFVGVSFQDNNWVISAFVNGIMTYYNKPGSLEQNASYVLSLIVTPRFVNAFINGSSIGVLSFSHIDGYGNILLKSIDGEEGFFANVTISQPQVSLIIYERDGV